MRTVVTLLVFAFSSVAAVAWGISFGVAIVSGVMGDRLLVYIAEPGALSNATFAMGFLATLGVVGCLAYLALDETD